MPRAQSASLHETPRLVREMSEEAKPFLNDVQRQALDAALAAKLAKLSGDLHLLTPGCASGKATKFCMTMRCDHPPSATLSRHPWHGASSACCSCRVSPDCGFMASIAAADAGGGRPTPALRSKSGSLRPTKSELLQDKKSRTGKTSTRTSKKDGAGAAIVKLTAGTARPALRLD